MSKAKKVIVGRILIKDARDDEQRVTYWREAELPHRARGSIPRHTTIHAQTAYEGRPITVSIQSIHPDQIAISQMTPTLPQPAQ